MFSKNYRGFDVPLKVASGSSWEHLRAYAAERPVPPRAVEARISCLLYTSDAADE